MNRPENVKRRNPWVSAICNFIVPGIGYIYNGIGRDRNQVIFGALIFFAYLISYVNIFGTFFFGSASTVEVDIVPPIVNNLAYFILPLAVAYDGYKRTNLSINN